MQAFDHAGIYLLIAATYTPFMTLVNNKRAYWVLYFEWTVCVLGNLAFILIQTGAIHEKSGFAKAYNKIETAMFAIMGWACLIIYKLVWKLPNKPFWFLLAG